MKLFYSPAGCSLLPHIVLRELGLPFVLEPVDLRTKVTGSGVNFMTINPKGYVPRRQVSSNEHASTPT